MTEPAEAARILDRLAGQWPGMAATDAAADDWIAAIRKVPDPHGLADVLIGGWTRDRGPRVADWFDAARDQAQRRALEASMERPALESGPPPNPERLAEILAAARDAVTEARRQHPTNRRAPVSKYDQVPVVWGEHLMTPEERAEELARFGDRKVRGKRP